MINSKYLIFLIFPLTILSCKKEVESVFNFKMNGEILPSNFMGQPFPQDDAFVLQSDCTEAIQLSVVPPDLNQKNFYWKLDGINMNHKEDGLLHDLRLNDEGLHTIELCNKNKCLKKFIHCTTVLQQEDKVGDKPIVKENINYTAAITAQVTKKPTAAKIVDKQRAIAFALSPNDKINIGETVEFKITDGGYSKIPSLFWLINRSVKIPVEGRFVNYTFNQTGMQTILLCSDDQICNTKKIEVLAAQENIVKTKAKRAIQEVIKPSSNFSNCDASYFTNLNIPKCENGDWRPSISVEFIPKQDLKISTFKIILNEDADVFISITEESKSILNNESYFLLGGTSRNQIRFRNLDLAEFYFKKNKKYLIKIGSNDGRIYDWNKCRINTSSLSNSFFDLKSSSNSIYDLRICI